jgi:hypothetical protein
MEDCGTALSSTTGMCDCRASLDRIVHRGQLNLFRNESNWNGASLQGSLAD